MAKFEAFIGGSYQSQAVTADQEQTTNWYPEQLESKGATAKTALYPTPGVEAVTTSSPGSGRAHFFMGGREFAVIGAKFVEVDQSGTVTSRGTVAVDSRPATISSNGDGGGELFITSGTNGYLFTLATNAFASIAALNGKADMGDYLDGYFLALDASSSTLYISDLFDGATWNTGLNFAQRSLAQDNWRSMKVLGRYIWLLGEYTSEIWQDTGANFPFAPFPSMLIPYGIRAPFSACVVGNALCWLGNTRSGKVCVLKSTGDAPAVISSYPLEMQLQGYAGVENAIGDSYSDAGHSFYMLSVDSSDVTWAWDAETSLWHRRGTWQPTQRKFVSWRPRFYAFAFGEHRILDIFGGTIYRMSRDLYLDVDGLVIRRVRRSPAIMNENKRVYYSSFELDLEPGLGIVGGKAQITGVAVWSGLADSFDLGSGTIQRSSPH